MQESLIDQGLNLMLYGMGTVFVFLTILVFATKTMSALVSKFSPEQEQTLGAATPPQVTSSAPPSPQVLEAIKQAITSHKQR